MKNFLIATIVLVVITPAISQQKPEVWSEARKAIEYVENEQFVVDSLRKTYYKKWILNFTYGQRFISSTNESIKPDTITFTDFTDKKSFFGVGGSYFWKDNWQIGVGVNFSIIPKKQEISSISFGNSGIEAEGQGSGGAIISLNLNTRYFLAEWKYIKPYLGLELSSIRLIAKGGEGTISGFNRTTSIRTRRSSFVSGQLLAGFTYRATPVFMIDWNIGYAHTSDDEPIGGITSLSGITTSLNLQFILNPKK